MSNGLSQSTDRTTIKKTIRYFRFDDRYNSLKGVFLEDKLREAFSSENSANVRFSCKNRLYPGQEQIFINHFYDVATTTDTDSYFFGELVSFGDKGRPSAVDQDLDQPLVPIVRVNAPQGKQWVIAPLYFLLKGNHVFVITSQSLKVDSLEKYMCWLLSFHTKVTSEMLRLKFRCEFDRDIIGEDFSEINSIKIRDPSHLLEDQSRSMFPTSALRKEAKTSAKRFGLDASNLLRRLFGCAPLPDEIYDRISSNKNILVDVGFKFERSSSKNDSDDMRSFLDVFRDIPDEMIEVCTKNFQIKDGKIRLQVVDDIKTLEDNRSLDPADAARSMFFYYHHLIKCGKIKN